MDILEIKNTLRVGIQVDVKTYRGPAPKQEKCADWKVLYRTCRSNNNRWMLRISCNSTALVNSLAKAKVTVILYNSEHAVLQVEHGETFTFDSFNFYDIELNLIYPNESRKLVLLIKPVLF